MSGEVVGLKIKFMDAHKFQRDCCEKAEQPILNVACKEDPAGLGHHFNAINFDVLDYDDFSKKDLRTQVKNFVQGDALKLTEHFNEKSYPTIVLGEFLEHCVPAAAQLALSEIRKVLTDDGKLIVTFPLDNRAPERQHGRSLLKVVVAGESGHDITTWHQTVWDLEKFEVLLSEVGFKIYHKQTLKYGFIRDRDPAGYGMVLKKE